MASTLYILGSGTCFPAAGRPRRHHPGFYIQWGQEPDQHLLLEASAGIAERLEDIAGVTADQVLNLAVSHSHPDHCFVSGLVQASLCAHIQNTGDGWQDNGPTMNLFAPSNIVESLPSQLDLHFPEAIGTGPPFPQINAVVPGRDPIEIGGATLQAFEVQHGFGRCPALAFRLTLPTGQVVVYSGDTGLCDGIVEAARGATIFICEASSRVGDLESATGYGHLSPRQAASVARDANAHMLILTHYSGADSDKAMIADAVSSGYEESIILAKDGQSIPF